MIFENGQAGSAVQPKFEMHLQPMGHCLRLVSNSAAIVAAAEASFGRFGSPPAGTVADFTFHFFEDNAGGISGQGASHAGTGPGEAFRTPAAPLFRRENHLIYQTAAPDSTLVADLNQGFAFGYFPKSVVDNRPYFQWHFLELALFQMLEGRGLMGVHASALVKNGRAALLRAPSGGGKTTLAYAGARRRFQVLAEDVVWIDPVRNHWWGVPWTFHLLPDASKLFPELAGYAPVMQTSGEMKLTVYPEKIRPASTVCLAEPGPLVFVERRPGERSRLEAIGPESARSLWPRAQTGLESQLSHHGPIIRKLTENDTYLLRYGDDIDMTLDLLEALF